MSSLFAYERLVLSLLLRVVQSSLQICFSHRDGRLATDFAGIADLGIGPALGSFEQRVCSHKASGSDLACMEKGLEGRMIFFGHGDSNAMLPG
jgi:hypothetical protein